MEPWLLALQALFGLVSWLLYFLVTRFVISQRKTFSISFVRLWVTFALINFLSYTMTMLSMRIPLHLTQTSPLASLLVEMPFKTFVYFCSLYLHYCQRITVFFFVLITFRAIVFPFSSRPVWEERHWLTLLVIFGLPIPFTFKIFDLNATYNYISTLDGYILYPKSIQALHYLLRANVFEVGMSVVCGVLNVIALVALTRKSSRRHKGFSKLAITMFIFACSLIKFFFALLIVFERNSRFIPLVLYMYPMFTDALNLSSPYALFFVNKRVRRAVCKSLGCGEKALISESEPVAV